MAFGFDTLTIIVICLVVSFFFSELFFKLRYPRVIGQILAGVLLGIPLFKTIFSADALADIRFLSDLGIIFLLLLAGLQVNIKKFRKYEKDSLIIAVWSACIPFAFGFGLMRLLGYSNTVALIVGTALSITSEGTKLKVLMEDKVLNTRVGTIMIEAAILDDIFEMLFLSIILLLAHGTASELMFFPLKLLVFVVVAYLGYKIFPKFLDLLHKEKSRIATFSGMLIFAIIVALIAGKLGLGPIIGAFIAGIIIQISEKGFTQEKREEIRELEVMTFSFIVPFFFINIGLHLNFTSLVHNLWLTLLVLVVGTVGKILGTVATTPFTSLKLKQTYLIGWGMNSRGAIELVIAEIARQSGLITIEVYSAIVFMAVVTTIMFPFVLKHLVSKDKTVMY